ncbi:uncharacterized protein SPSK_01284 [Sporothrix schenckii 1099-18]|uniref:Uncharacterized protein n=1 Tax=Sporothrix schenckii 1099-18 TaxID=1397361 RepID=A0A0F2LVL9_SPOSC|nr:uncharacterized protein SPSK_01284 [Sporothrix schenckii 1099-18]KJR81493.1 hypothetical protein SPSK_01284 [Sporothrix schenckii 1099-18]
MSIRTSTSHSPSHLSALVRHPLRHETVRNRQEPPKGITRAPLPVEFSQLANTLATLTKLRWRHRPPSDTNHSTGQHTAAEDSTPNPLISTQNRSWRLHHPLNVRFEDDNDRGWKDETRPAERNQRLTIPAQDQDASQTILKVVAVKIKFAVLTLPLRHSH